MRIQLGNKHIILKKRFFLAIILIVGIILSYFFLWEQAKERYIAGLEKAQVEVLGNKEPSSKSKQQAIKKLKDQYKNKFVIIFFYDGYKDQNDALTYIAVMKGALDLVEPYKSLKDIIAYKTFTTESEKCKVEDLPAARLPDGQGRQETRTKILTCDKKLIDSFRSLGIDRFKLVILSPFEFASTALPARGNNSWMTISTSFGNTTRDENKRLVGLEFAQSLGRSLGLSAEGVASGSAQTKSLVENPPNCAKDLAQAETWWGVYLSLYNVGYIKGCAGNPDFLYPEEGTLMSSSPKKESYGAVSEDYLRGVISCFYGEKETLTFPAGLEATYSATLSSCKAFKNVYKEFWRE